MSKSADIDDTLVAMAGIGVAQHRGTLRTLLGSCIGVALFERKLKLVGLTHIVMPDSMGREQPAGKYADTAIPEAIRQMKRLSGVLHLSLSAKIAGGANMFAHVSPGNTNAIGDQNVAAVEKILESLQIPTLGRHIGGTVGRRMVIDVESGAVQIHILGQSMVQL
jgi:chemotaxis protein CheD